MAAVALAERSDPALLSTTDPATQFAATITGNALPHLTGGRIYLAADTARYASEVLQAAGTNRDEPLTIFRELCGLNYQDLLR